MRVLKIITEEFISNSNLGCHELNHKKISRGGFYDEKDS